MGLPLPEDLDTWSIAENVYVCNNCSIQLTIQESYFLPNTLHEKICFLEKSKCGCCGVKRLHGTCKHNRYLTLATAILKK